MDIGEAVRRLGDADAGARFGALAALQEAFQRGEDLGSTGAAIVKALSDRDADVRQKAARILVSMHGKAGRWGEIDALLRNPRGDVRASALDALAQFIGRFDMRADVPSLGKAPEDADFEARASAASFFEKASAARQDISFVIPALRKLAIYGDLRMKESVANTLKNDGMRAGGAAEGGSGGRCMKCLGCETGIAPGEAAGCFLEKALIIKSIACCAGDVTHRVFMCRACGQHYVSTYFDHSDSGNSQFSILVVGAEDAARAAAEFRKCPSPQWKACKCPVHEEYLKDESVPITGTLKYKSG